MKTKYILLVFAIIFGFAASNKASGQNGCEACVYPWPNMCYILNFNIPGCSGDMQAVFCYECGVTAPIIKIRVAELTYCPECDDAAWDYVYNWAKQNWDLLCGIKPCDEPPQIEFTITKPICAELIWSRTVGRIRAITHSGDCDLRCTEKWQVCIDYSGGIPVKRETLLERYPSGNGSCEYIPHGDDPDAPPEYRLDQDYWRIPCSRITRTANCIPFP